MKYEIIKREVTWTIRNPRNFLNHGKSFSILVFFFRQEMGKKRAHPKLKRITTTTHLEYNVSISETHLVDDVYSKQ